MTTTDEVRKTWDEMDIDAVRSVSWFSLQTIKQAIERRFSGDLYEAILLKQMLAERNPEAARHGMIGGALVCGDMAGERWLFDVGNDARIAEVHGYDLSEQSLQRFTSESFVFHPHAADLNRPELPEDFFDVLVGLQGIHHIQNLSGLFAAAHKALKPSGLFFMEEWIGPEYLQIPFRNRLAAYALLRLLFSKARRTTHSGKEKTFRLQDPPESFDPSEACNSGRLYPEFKRYFKPLRTVFYGGLCYPVFEGIAQNLNESDPMIKSKILRCLKLERFLTSLGCIRPLFVRVIAQRR